MATTNIILDSNSYIYSGDANYNNARSSSDSISTASSLVVGQSAGYSIYRTFLRFDTSTLSGTIINQVNLRMVAETDTSAIDFDLQIVKCDWSAYDPLGVGNRTDAFLLVQSSDRDSNIWRNTSGMSLDTQYTSGNLSTAWINTAGNTYYALQSSRDYAATTPSGNEYSTLYQLNDNPESYRPTLIIDYDYPALGTYFYT